MASRIVRNSDAGYMSFQNQNVMPSEAETNYYPVNVYSKDFRRKSEKRLTFCDFLRICCCCCLPRPEECSDSTVYNNPSSSLTKAKRSYYVKQNTLAVSSEKTIPALIVTKTLEDDITKSSTKLLLSAEQMASSISLATPTYTVKKVQNRDHSRDPSEETTDSNSRCSTLKSGEKVSFIRDILICRDSFLKSLEWCDNSLTRGIRCRRIKTDEWLELKTNGTEIYVFLRHM